ncbi:MAG TPA: hypothetical protein V6C50_11140, partial [Crinalium sp.]
MSFNLKTLRLHREWLSPEWYSKRLSPSWQACIPLALLIVVGWSVAASAQAPTTPTVESVAESVGSLKVGLDTMWVMVASMLVFFMNAGLCMLE